MQIHGPITPVIEMRKFDYNESTGILTVHVFLKGGITISDYSVTIKYDTDELQEEIYSGTSSAININTGCPIHLTSSSCGEGTISLVGGGGTTATESFVCAIKFKLKNKPLEEEIPNNLFKVSEGIVNDEDDTYYDENYEPIKNIVNIDPMASIVDGITVINPEFDYTTDTNGDGINDSYKYGDNINLVGGTATVNYSNTKNTTRTAILKLDETDGIYKWFEINGDTEKGNILNITKGPWKANTLGTQNLNINYKGKNSNNVGIKVVDEIENITITPVRTYYYGDNFNYENTKVNIKWRSKSTPEVKTLKELVDNHQSTLTGFNSTLDKIRKSSVEQDITVNFNYEGYVGTKNFKVTIKDKIEKVTFEEGTIKKDYEYKEPSLDLTGGIINITWISGATDERPLNNIEIKTGSSSIINNNVIASNLNDSIKVTGFNNEVTGTQPIKIEYHYADETIPKEFNYNIKIKPRINSMDNIELTKKVITVQWGEELNFTDEYKVIPIMTDETKQEGILFTNDKVQIEGSYNLREEGTYKVKIIYEGKKADFTIIVVDPIIEVRLDDEEKEKIQKEYKYNEELNLNEAQLTIVRKSGEYKEKFSRNITDYNKETLGKQQISINYKDNDTQTVYKIKNAFEVEVKDYIVDIILVKPNKTTYLPGEKLDLTGATVRTISASGKLGDEVAVTEDIISGYTEGILGAQRITVHYEGFEKTFDVIFTAQTGVANSNTYAMVATIIATASLTIVAMLTIIQKEEERNKKM